MNHGPTASDRRLRTFTPPRSRVLAGLAVGTLAGLTSAATAGPGGLYVKGSAVWVDRLDGEFLDNSGAIDALVTGDLSGAGDVAFDDGFGFSAGLGVRFDPIPLALEIEYVFSSNDVDSVSGAVAEFSASGEYESHLVSLNAYLDAANVLGPVGFYVGGGIGFAYSDFSIDRIQGIDVSGVVSGDSEVDFAWQLMAGATFSLFDRAQIYAGIRYMNTSEVDLGGVIGESDAIVGEIGLRFFF